MGNVFEFILSLYEKCVESVNRLQMSGLHFRGVVCELV